MTPEMTACSGDEGRHGMTALGLRNNRDRFNLHQHVWVGKARDADQRRGRKLAVREEFGANTSQFFTIAQVCQIGVHFHNILDGSSGCFHHGFEIRQSLARLSGEIPLVHHPPILVL
jgi:hypothetical protein